MSPFQFLFIRASMSSIFNIVIIIVEGKNFKEVLWNSLKQDETAKEAQKDNKDGQKLSNRCALVTKVIHGYFNTSIGFALVKWFPITYSSATRQMTSFFSFPLAICFLAEYPTWRQSILMTLIMGLYLGFVMAGGQNISENDLSYDELSHVMKIVAWGLLLIYPLILAIGNILNRMMRKLDENVVSTYGNFTQTFFFLAIVCILG